MKKRKTEKQSGFTIIELIVVVSIIGLLGSIILVSTGKARMAARDARRIADTQAIANAMNLFYATYGFIIPCSGIPGLYVYPGGCDLVNTRPDGTQGYSDSSLDGIYVPFLIQTGYLPVKSIMDPLNTAISFYAFGQGEYPPGSGVIYDYMVVSILENPNHPILKTGLRVVETPQMYAIAQRHY
jgi:prepilin-type N-terminal cleavage/methylation domain-containing protein